MRKIVYFTITLSILLSCSRERASINITNENNEAIKINEIQGFEFVYDSRDIFYYLFSDIKNNYNDYNYDRNYTIIKDSPFDRDFLLPKESYVVKNDYIEIDYFPSSYFWPEVIEIYRIDGIIPEYLPFQVNIRNYSDKYYLGKYFSKNIDHIFEDFENTYKEVSQDIINKIFIFEDDISYISFSTRNDIITNITLGYFVLY